MGACVGRVVIADSYDMTTVHHSHILWERLSVLHSKSSEPWAALGSNSELAVLVHALNDGGVRGATTLADRKEAILALPTFELVDKRGHELRSRGTEGVTESHRPPIHIQ